jgi:hypothetical protein
VAGGRGKKAEGRRQKGKAEGRGQKGKAVSYDLRSPPRMKVGTFYLEGKSQRAGGRRLYNAALSTEPTIAIEGAVRTNLVSPFQF